jgi:N-acetylglucosamine-6-phosphate deacetylase
VSLAVAFRAKPTDRIVLVTDAVATAGLDVVDGAPRLPDGTIAGSVLTMDQAVRNLVGTVGIDLVDTVRAAATNPADVLGALDRGRLAVGARADLVLLDDDLRVQQVWIGGHPVT